MNLASHRGLPKPRAAAVWPVLVVLLIVALLPAVAESACTNGSDPLWISSQSDADTLSSCKTISTDITIQNDVLTTITLHGIRRIDGFLEAVDCSLLATIEAPDLEWINSEFRLRNLPRLNNVSFPQLETITEGVYWEDLPMLVSPILKSQGVDNFNNPGTNIYGDLYVQSCGLETLNDFNFGTFARAGNIKIMDNPALKEVNFTGLVDANDIEVMKNAPDATLLLSELSSVGKLSVQGVSSIDVSSLETMESDLTLSGNTFNQLRAPKLEAIGGDLLIEDNDKLSSLELLALETIGGGYKDGYFKVINNPLLDVLNLPRLRYTDGNTSFTGKFEEISLPSLAEMSTGFHITTTTTGTFNCSAFDYIFHNSEISSTPSRYHCTAFSPTSSEKDTALHYSPPRAHPAVSKPTLIVIIVICIIMSLAISTFLIRGFYIRPMRRRRREVAQAEATEMRRRDIAFAVANRRTGSRSTTGEDKLPPYRRVGHPGEVPPGYEGGEAPEYEDAIQLQLQIPEQTAQVGRERDAMGDLEMQEGDRGSRNALRLLLPRFR